MKNRTNIFTDHPASVGETYLEHLRTAAGFGLHMVTAGIACLIHGLIPALFVKTGSSTIDDLHQRMVRNRRHSSGKSSDSGLT